MGSIGDFKKAFRYNQGVAMMMVGRYVYQNLVSETPYDKRRAKRSWGVNQSRDERSFPDLDAKKSTDLKMDKPLSNVASFNRLTDKEMRIYSQLEYMGLLEEGHSKQNKNFIANTARGAIRRFGGKTLT